MVLQAPRLDIPRGVCGGQPLTVWRAARQGIYQVKREASRQADLASHFRWQKRWKRCRFSATVAPNLS